MNIGKILKNCEKMVTKNNHLATKILGLVVSLLLNKKVL